MTSARGILDRGQGSSARQSARKRRNLMAAATSVLVIFLLALWNLLGLLETGPFLLISGVIVFWVLVFHWIFTTGRNRRSADASLTLPQMGVASFTLLGAIYAANQGRAIFLVVLMMVFMFGALRLRTRALLFYTAFVVAGYAVVIGLLRVFKPQTLDLVLELEQLLVLAVTMPWFALMGGYTGGLRDKLKVALRSAEESERTMAQAQRLAHFGNWTLDLASGVVTCSAETYRIFGRSPDDGPLNRDEFARVIHGDDRHRYAQLIESVTREGQPFDAEYRIELPSGATRWVHTHAQSDVDDKGRVTLVRGTVLDITERKAAEEKIQQFAHFDTLTGLANRNLLMELLRLSLAKAQRNGTSFGILFIDLDGFKKVNDTLGHDAGDFVLAAFAARLGHCIRKTDIAARIGGDEFVVVVDEFELPRRVEIVAQRILQAASAPNQFENHDCSVSASVGIALYPRAGNDIDTLINNADEAMYAAKRQGKNTYRFWTAERNADAFGTTLL